MIWKLYIFDKTNWVFWKDFETKEAAIAHGKLIYDGLIVTSMYPGADKDHFRLECPGIGSTYFGF